MAGGPTTPALVVAAAEAGALGFLAAGYKTSDAMTAEMATVRAATDEAFGVNVFVPQPRGDSNAVATYLASLQVDAARLDVELGEPRWDDDDWEAKVAALLDNPPATVTFTFACPPTDVITAFRSRGCMVGVTVTTPAEAMIAVDAGADYLCAQGLEAGAHRGSFHNSDGPGQDFGVLSLLSVISEMTDVPIVAAGGLGSPRAVAAVMAAGAVAAQAGTAFLRCPESGAHPVYKAALADERFTTTAITRAFSGRPARGLLNQFMIDHAGAPPAYPEINNATRPLRAAASAAGDAHRMSLWAGQGFRSALEHPAGEIVEFLASGVSRA
jgi:nitronate monooxygenase